MVKYALALFRILIKIIVFNHSIPKRVISVAFLTMDNVLQSAHEIAN